MYVCKKTALWWTSGRKLRFPAQEKTMIKWGENEIFPCNGPRTTNPKMLFIKIYCK